MSAKKISQRDAQRLKRRVDELEQNLHHMRNRWSSAWVPGWVNIDNFVLSDAQFARLSTARLLKHAVIIVPAVSGNEVKLYAEPLS